MPRSENTPVTPEALLEAAHIPQAWRDRERFTLLETDFQNGAGFLSTWQAWRLEAGLCSRLHFLSLAESLPPLSNDPSWRALSEELRRRLPLNVPGFHRMEFEDGRLILTLALGDRAQSLRRLEAQVDAFLVHPTDGELNNQATPPLLKNLARLAAPGALISLAGSAPENREILNSSGFELSPSEFPKPGLAIQTGRFRASLQRRKTVGAGPSVREAMVIGAGLAGTAAAARLAARGWKVQLLDRHASPAQEASGNLAAVLSPLLSKDDGRAARLSRASFLFLLQELAALSSVAAPPRWSPCGVLQLAKDAREERNFAEIAARQAYPSEFARWLTREEASRELRREAPAGGWLFPGGGWVNPPSLCSARLRASSGIQTLFGREVHAIRRVEGIWQALDSQNQVIAQAPRLILANANEALRLAPQAGLVFKRVRGQVTHLDAALLPEEWIERVVSRDGYLTPPVEGVHALGATYDFHQENASLDPESHAANLARLPHLIAAPPMSAAPPLQGRVGFRSLTPDRMPVVGALASGEGAGGLSGERGEDLRKMPREPGLYAVLGLGSRGLVWSALAGEILACMLENEPLPVESDLVAAIDPARFVFSGFRQAQTAARMQA